jgi:uncharacterized protein (TIGR03437 family)
VTPANPARANEVIHLYGVGFGLVDPTPPTGTPAPSDPPAHTVFPIMCSTASGTGGQLQVPVLFSGLALGLVGYYQLDIRIPPSNLAVGVGFTLGCVGYGTFSASFPVKP